MKLPKIDIKFVTNFLMGLKSCDEVGVGGALFSKIPQVGDFSYFRSKSMITYKETKMSTAGAHQPTFLPFGVQRQPYTNERRRRVVARQLVIFRSLYRFLAYVGFYFFVYQNWSFCAKSVPPRNLAIFSMFGLCSSPYHFFWVCSSPSQFLSLCPSPSQFFLL